MLELAHLDDEFRGADLVGSGHATGVKNTVLARRQNSAGGCGLTLMRWHGGSETTTAVEFASSIEAEHQKFYTPKLALEKNHPSSALACFSNLSELYEIPISDCNESQRKHKKRNPKNDEKINTLRKTAPVFAIVFWFSVSCLKTAQLVNRWTYDTVLRLNSLYSPKKERSCIAPRYFESPILTCF